MSAQFVCLGLWTLIRIWFQWVLTSALLASWHLFSCRQNTLPVYRRVNIIKQVPVPLYLVCSHQDIGRNYTSQWHSNEDCSVKANRKYPQNREVSTNYQINHPANYFAVCHKTPFPELQKGKKTFNKRRFFYFYVAVGEEKCVSEAGKRNWLWEEYKNKLWPAGYTTWGGRCWIVQRTGFHYFYVFQSLWEAGERSGRMLISTSGGMGVWHDVQIKKNKMAPVSVSHTLVNLWAWVRQKMHVCACVWGDIYLLLSRMPFCSN